MYTKSHEWVRIDGEVATLGITEYAQSELGDIVYVDLPTVGRALAQGDTVGSVESVKTVSDIYAPVSGAVTEVNEALAIQPELLNSDPYGGGWLLKLKVPGAEFGELLDASAYEALLNA